MCTQSLFSIYTSNFNDIDFYVSDDDTRYQWSDLNYRYTVPDGFFDRGAGYAKSFSIEGNQAVVYFAEGQYYSFVLEGEEASYNLFLDVLLV